MSYNLLDELAASQQVVVAMMHIAADDSSARVGAWSLRDIAAHLATTEKECFEPRIRAMAAGERPRFEFYSNDDRDFDGVSLETALADWTDARARLLDFVSGLSDEERTRVGVHERYGELTVDGYLRIAIEHDHDHLSGLERLATEASR